MPKIYNGEEINVGWFKKILSFAIRTHANEVPETSNFSILLLSRVCFIAQRYGYNQNLWEWEIVESKIIGMAPCTSVF